MKKLPVADLEHILDHTRELWDELRGTRMFITGGTGFFGCWLLESFVWASDRLNLNCRTTVLSRSPDLFKTKVSHLAAHPSVSLMQGDIRNFEFPKGEFSHVIHAATYMQPFSAPLNSRMMFNENIQGTDHVLDFADTCQAKKLLFTSSGAAYGKQPPEITHISEDYAGAPSTTEFQAAYGQSKRACEFLCATTATASGLQAKIARCFTFVGPLLPLDTNYAIGNFIRDALNGGPIIVQGDGTPRRSYLYAADLAIWLWTILVRGRSSFPYNVGSENDLSIAELAKATVNAIAPSLPVQIVQEQSYGKPIERYVPATQRAKNELGLQELISLSDALKRTAQWYSPTQ